MTQRDRILLFIPMYNCSRQIERVISQLTPDVQALFSELLIVDNRSTDGGCDVAARGIESLNHLPARVLVNDRNYGLGGSHKVAFLHALEREFSHVVVLHGDDQGDIADLAPRIERKEHRGLDALLGARFMAGSKLQGYSLTRTLGNRALNLMYSAASRYRIHDLGSGLNLYSTGALRDRQWLRNSDDLTFNYQMILRSIAAGWTMRFFPLTWREADQVSNVRLVRQSVRAAKIALDYAVGRARHLAADHSRRSPKGYTSTAVHMNAAAR